MSRIKDWAWMRLAVWTVHVFESTHRDGRAR